MNASEIILYVADQQRATRFYAATLRQSPTLEVPGMTEFDLGGVTLGLMPAADMAALLPRLQPGTGQRCELYLRRADAREILGRAVDAGGELLAGLAPRTWGELVGYVLDPDGHVLALAEPRPAGEQA